MMEEQLRSGHRQAVGTHAFRIDLVYRRYIQEAIGDNSDRAWCVLSCSTGTVWLLDLGIIQNLAVDLPCDIVEEQDPFLFSFLHEGIPRSNIA